MLRWILGGIACVIVGVMFINRYLSDVPPLDQLTEVAGEVVSAEVETRRSRRSQANLLAVRVGDKPAAFYSERFPDYDTIASAIRPGDRVTIWVDVGNNNYIWQVQKGDERLVSYDQVADVQRSNNRNNGLMGIGFLVFGIATVVVMLLRLRSAGSAPVPDEATSSDPRKAAD